MTIAERIYAYLRQAKAHDGKARISDYQLQVGKNAVTLLNLKTDEKKVFPVDPDKDADWY